MYSAARYFAPRMFAARFFAGVVVAADPSVPGVYNGPHYFPPRYFAPRMFAGVPAAVRTLALAGPGGPIADGGTDDAGTVTAGATASRIYTLASTGTASVQITGFAYDAALAGRVTGPDVVGGQLAVTLAPGQQTTLTVDVPTSVLGAAGYSVTVASNAAGGPLDWEVDVTVVAAEDSPPDPADVRQGVVYVVGGVTYTGTLEGGEIYFRHVVRQSVVPIVAGSGPADRWTVVDRQSPPDPVDLSGTRIRLVGAAVARRAPLGLRGDVFSAPASYETGDGRLTVGGGGGNVVTVRYDPTKTSTPGLHAYWLLNVTDRVVLARGDMQVLPIASGAWD